MPDVSSIPVIASDRIGIEVRRHGQPLPLSAAQREQIRRGFEILVEEGLTDDGFDVRRANPVQVSLKRTGPGAYDLISCLHDARALHRRLLFPLGPETLAEAQRHLHHAAETVLTGVEMISIILAAGSARVGSAEDDAGLVPMVIDGRFVMRVPWSIFRIVEASPRAQDGADAVKHLFEQDDAQITLLRGKGENVQPSESVLQVPRGLWERLRDVRILSYLEDLQMVEDPLQDLVTRSQRDELPRVTQRDVGPDAPGSRGDDRMPPPGPRI